MTFFDKLEKETTKTRTLNGAPTYSSSLNKNLDFFALAGAARNLSDYTIQDLFADAYREDKELALRNLVHLRNIRQGGLGERRAFRAILPYFNRTRDKHVLVNLAKYLPEIGRWDDVVAIFSITTDKKVKELIAKQIRDQLAQDVHNLKNNKPISLMAKWLPSVNTSSAETRKVAKELIKYLQGEVTPKAEKVYRKVLKALRDYLNVVEVNMTNKQYHKINYEEVPSLAAIRYRNAFHRNDPERYGEYLEKLDKGKAKVNASVTYPYQIVEAYLNKGTHHVDILLENAWKSLPDYIGDSDERAIVVADTSGSMYGTPMNVAISLAIYCAQRLKGEFHGKYITFSANPSLLSVSDEATLAENIDKVYVSEWGYNTDINKVFDLILKTAVNNNMTQDELPNKIIIISDMEFDEATTGHSYWWGGNHNSEPLTETNYEFAKKEFAKHGYEIPQIIFWNVDAKQTIVPVRKDEIGTALVSGLTPAIFESVLNGKISDPVQVMLDTLNQEKYDFVKDILYNRG